MLLSRLHLVFSLLWVNLPDQLKKQRNLMENTSLAFKLHTSGCWKNGSPLMWWLQGFNFKFSFRKKNTLFRWAVFPPWFLSSFPLICCLHYQLLYFLRHLNKIITYLIWALPQFTHLVYVREELSSCLRFQCDHTHVHICMQCAGLSLDYWSAA